MKLYKSLILVGAVFSLVGCSEQIPEAEIPSVVRNTIDVEFVNARDVEWEKKGAIYKVEFEVENSDYEALLEETGALIKYRKEISRHELPQPLLESLKSPGGIEKIKDMHLLVIGENTYYQLEYKGTLTNPRKVYDETGEEMKEIKYYD